MPLAQSNLWQFILNLYTPFTSKDELLKKCKCPDVKSIKYKLTTDLLAGIKYLHLQNILHGDIKPSNGLIFMADKETIQLKLADFGLSLHLGLGRNRVFNIPMRLGTKYYRPPENYDVVGYQLLTDKFDIWAAGLTILYIYTGLSPANLGLYDKTQVITAFRDDFRMEFLSSLLKDKLLVDLLCHMLNPNYQARYNIEQVFKHKFMERVSNIDGHVFLPSVNPRKTPDIKIYYGFHIIVILAHKFNAFTETVFLAADLYQRLIHIFANDIDMSKLIQYIIIIWSLAYRIVDFNLTVKLCDIINAVDSAIITMRKVEIPINWPEELELEKLIKLQYDIIKHLNGIIYRPYSLYQPKCIHTLIKNFDVLPNFFQYFQVQVEHMFNSGCTEPEDDCLNKTFKDLVKFNEFYTYTGYHKLYLEDPSLKLIYNKDYDIHYSNVKM